MHNDDQNTISLDVQAVYFVISSVRVLSKPPTEALKTFFVCERSFDEAHEKTTPLREKHHGPTIIFPLYLAYNHL